MFFNQYDVNNFLINGNNPDLVNFDSVASGILPEDTGEYSKVRVERLKYLDKSLLIDEFGNIKDAKTFEIIEPSLVKVNNKYQLCIPMRNSKKQFVYKRVIHLVAMAFLKDSCPERIKTYIDNPLACYLSNVRVPSVAQEQESKSMQFTSQHQIDLFCRLNDIHTVNELLMFFPAAKSIKDINESRFKVQYIEGLQPDSSFLSEPIHFFGSVLYVDKVGAVYKRIDNRISRLKSRFLEDGKVKVSLYCKDGKNRDIIVANMVAKAFYDLDKRKLIKYIDGNPLNTCVENLWYNGCDRLFTHGD